MPMNRKCCAFGDCSHQLQVTRGAASRRDATLLRGFVVQINWLQSISLHAQHSRHHPWSHWTLLLCRFLGGPHAFHAHHSTPRSGAFVRSWCSRSHRHLARVHRVVIHGVRHTDLRRIRVIRFHRAPRLMRILVDVHGVHHGSGLHVAAHVLGEHIDPRIWCKLWPVNGPSRLVGNLERSSGVRPRGHSVAHDGIGSFVDGMGVAARDDDALRRAHGSCDARRRRGARVALPLSAGQSEYGRDARSAPS